MLESVFWLSLAALGYTYLGYPLVLWIWSKTASHPVHKAPAVLPVSIVIAAHNEAETIAKRIENCLALDYPAREFEIIVVSDGSTDGTAEIVRRYERDRVRLLVLPTRAGKATALNHGMSEAKGEVIIFTDTRQTFEPSAARELVANFQDPNVGAVTGELVLQEAGADSMNSSGRYWRYEKWIRKAESRIDSVIGATGAIYAIRKALFAPLPPGAILDDVIIPMRIALQGYRVVFEEKALAYDVLPTAIEQEFHRKVRTLAGNYQLLQFVPALWSPFRNRLFVQYFSHKVTRLLAPFWLMALLASSLALASGPYALALGLQAIGYGLAWAAWLMRRRSVRLPLGSAALTFVMLHYAAFMGLVHFLRGRRRPVDIWVKG